MKDQKNISRRDFFKLSLGALGGVAASSSLASMCGLTPPQTEGPFFPHPDTPEDPIRENPGDPLHLANDNDLTFVKGRSGIADGQQVLIRGLVQDQDCEPIPGATVVIWQASASGRYNHIQDDVNTSFPDPRSGNEINRELDPHFQYWGKDISGGDGSFSFKTIVPGFYPADLINGWYRPPHIHFMISALGYPQLTTQMYFRGDKIEQNDYYQRLNRRDSILQSSQISDSERENVLVDFEEVPHPGHESGKILEGSFIIKLKR